MIAIFFTVVLFGIAIYSMIGLFSLIRTFLPFHRQDDLERRRMVDALAISMGIILIVNLVQLVLSFFWPIERITILSPGAYRTGGLISNDPLHIDNFLFSCAIIGVSYRLRRHRYGIDGEK